MRIAVLVLCLSLAGCLWNKGGKRGTNVDPNDVSDRDWQSDTNRRL